MKATKQYAPVAVTVYCTAYDSGFTGYWTQSESEAEVFQ